MFVFPEERDMQGPFVSEDKVMFGVHAHAMSQMTIAKMRKIYNKVDSKSIAKQVVVLFGCLVYYSTTVLLFIIMQFKIFRISSEPLSPLSLFSLLFVNCSYFYPYLSHACHLTASIYLKM